MIRILILLISIYLIIAFVFGLAFYITIEKEVKKGRIPSGSFHPLTFLVVALKWPKAIYRIKRKEPKS